MQPTAPKTSVIPVPEIDSDEPVVVIPAASVAPLDGPPDGERINSFTLAPKRDAWAFEDLAVNAFGGMRDHVLSKPLTYVAAAFSVGFVLARMLR
jgi:hypothetical protein